MKKQYCLKKPLSALLALVMMLTLAPVAFAATSWCPVCRSYTCERSIVVEANCHEEGLAQYVCSTPGCSYGTVEKLPVDTSKHDIVYSDNGDGTHSGVCRYHADITTKPERHTYTTNGNCEYCGVSNYSAAAMDLPSDRIVPVALGDSSAKLTAGDVRITLGTSNITEDYELSYAWYQDSRLASEGSEYKLPASIYNTEGTYYFILMAYAQPKTGSRVPLSQTCRVTVKVAELISVSAVMTSDDRSLSLGSSTVWTPTAISDQIYDGVQRICGISAEPSSVVFTDVPNSNVGHLSVNSSPYTFSTGRQKLEDVIFTAGDATGDYVVGFTAYDSANKSYAGVLTITVQQYAGDMDVVCIASRNAALTLSSKDFAAFWEDRCPGGVLEYISFKSLPRAVDGTLYVNYSTSGLNADTLRIDDELYVSPAGRQYGIDTTAFVPSVGVKQQNYITLDFTAYGRRSSGNPTNRSGLLYIFFSDDLKSADISVTVPSTSTAGSMGTVLNPASFRSVYEKMAGSVGSFYIQLLNVPASGALYLNRTTASNGIRLTSDSIVGRPFFYSGSTVETIADLTYVPGSAASESIRYVASSAQGKPLFAGNINFTSSGTASTTTTGLVVDYASPATGVNFRGSDFVNAQGTGQPTLTSVCFTPPTALYGTLYYGRSAVNAGTSITSGSNWFSTSSSTVAGLNYVDGISFVPALSYTSGTVLIPFTALTSAGTRVTGTVRVTVGGAAANPSTSVDPGNNSNTSTTVPSTTVTPTVPSNAKTFKDVSQTAYYYPYVAVLTTTGVLSGYDDGTFRPDNTVNLGEALKMIMTSAGYPEQAATTSEWASGYLALAKSEGLLPAGTVETLSRPVDRYTIAEIAARALRLQLTAVAVSPFADMAVNHTAAPAVSALQQIGVLVGSDKDGQKIYQGEYAIRRRDFAVIIWRMQNYVRTGNVNGVQ